LAVSRSAAFHMDEASRDVGAALLKRLKL
jgi:hypothetical protein